MYIVVELQSNNGTTAVVTPIPTYADRNDAEANYHTVLAAAAKSNVEKHACVVLTEEGFPLLRECYKHEAQV